MNEWMNGGDIFCNKPSTNRYIFLGRCRASNINNKLYKNVVWFVACWLKIWVNFKAKLSFTTQWKPIAHTHSPNDHYVSVTGDKCHVEGEDHTNV